MNRGAVPVHVGVHVPVPARRLQAKSTSLVALGLALAVCTGANGGQQSNPCAALTGAALDRCQAGQQGLQEEQLSRQQQQLTQMQQQIQQQQQQLSEQQAQLQQQREQLVQQQQQLMNQQEQSRRMLTEQSRRQPAAIDATPEETEEAKREQGQTWRAENAWFGSDYARTQFATRYARQLQKDQPLLRGRPFLDAISAKVRETFGASH